jgi:hypothetical protein
MECVSHAISPQVHSTGPSGFLTIRLTSPIIEIRTFVRSADERLVKGNAIERYAEVMRDAGGQSRLK